MTFGNDCVRCHYTNNWLVDNIPEIHEQNGFPLFGVHNGVTCVESHQDETNLRFGNNGNDCLSCHLQDYNTTTTPNHAQVGFPTDCLQCHTLEADSWRTEVVDHSFFPLTEGHEIMDCKACHLTDNFSDASPDCFSCHQDDFNNAMNPNHKEANFGTDCTTCHSFDAWTPATFDHDAEYFPIYSGKHEGEWSECIDCHTNPSNFAIFTCINCHMNPETDDEHNGITGYVYEDNACLACHPTGDAADGFDHNATNFPLTGAHIGVDCIECHADGYVGTSTNCVDCHQTDFNMSTNPNHSSLGLSTDCVSCHTTDIGWQPVTFDIHDDLSIGWSTCFNS